MNNPSQTDSIEEIPFKGRILIVEDERPMREGLVDCLKAEGYRVVGAATGPDGLRCALEEKPDLVLLDVMMPGLDGFSLCRELRRMGRQIQVLMLTAKGRVQDRVQGLDSGADDYLVKPFSTQELLARIRAAFRRVRQEQREISRIAIGHTVFDFHNLKAERSGKCIHLTPKEWAVLKLLAEADGRVISREMFLDRVWGYDAFPTTRTVDSHIAMLRNKLEDDPGNPRYILTVHKTGYRLAEGNPNS